MNRQYIQNHCFRYQQAVARNQPGLAIDSLWRISSNADLHSIGELNQFTSNGMPENIQQDILVWLRLNNFNI